MLLYVDRFSWLVRYIILLGQLCLHPLSSLSPFLHLFTNLASGLNLVVRCFGIYMGIVKGVLIIDELVVKQGAVTHIQGSALHV